ncbi:hypothetical protein IJG98_01470 [Candidatus Saccharibacteria bacterium]|nr:hypothetical protein [Candidatus Saccharibacteria bacterium]
MEEKLYFKPASYGKGIKKKDKSTKPDESDKNNDHRIRNLILFLALIAIIVLIILWLLRGKTTMTGQYPENVSNESLTCVSANTQYEKTSWIDSDNKELKINAIFNGTESLKSISLIYTLYYADEGEAYYAEAKSHAQLNDGFAAIGFDVQKFDNKFARYGNKLIISLTANKSEINEYSASYFLLPVEDDGLKLKTISDYKNAFENQSFSCTATVE